MTQFSRYLKSAINIKKRNSQEELAITALGSQGSQKDIQKVMRSFGNEKKSTMETKGVSPEEFSKRFNGGL